nr:EOG090X09QP [Artemia franciscana]
MPHGCAVALKSLLESGSCVSRSHLISKRNSCAVPILAAKPEEFDTHGRINDTGPYNENLHNLKVEVSKLIHDNVSFGKLNPLINRTELEDVLKILTVYDEMFSNLSDGDMDHILRIHYDKVDVLEKSILWSSVDKNKTPKEDHGPPDGLPSKEQLQFIQDSLAIQLPRLFKAPLDYRIYHKNILFINNIRGTKTSGIVPYVRQVAFLRIMGHVKFSYVKFEILKITNHPEEGTVKVRWRISGVSGLRSLLFFWNIKLWNYKKSKEQMTDSWYDGFSTFKVGSDGLVHVHIADKLMPDDDREVMKVPLADKLAALIGVAPRPSATEMPNCCQLRNMAKTPDPSGHKNER